MPPGPRWAATGALLALALSLVAGSVWAQDRPGEPAGIEADPPEPPDADQPGLRIMPGRELALGDWTLDRTTRPAGSDAAERSELPGADQPGFQITPDRARLALDWTLDEATRVAGGDVTEPVEVPRADQPVLRLMPNKDWLALGDWTGLTRDTALLVGYQVLGVTFFYTCRRACPSGRPRQRTISPPINGGTTSRIPSGTRTNGG